ncbi:MAG: DNA repair protein RadA [Bdellovibrionia bacterium]
MGKIKVHYVCRSCGYSSHKWLGKCSGCGAWNSLSEETQVAPAEAGSLSAMREEFIEFSEREKAASPLEGLDFTAAPVQELGSASAEAGKPQSRCSTGLVELDRVLGGGLVRDSLILLGGDPGIGKSTLLLQMAAGLSQKNPDSKVFYASGEESVEQIRLRSSRLGVHGRGKIFLASETQLEKIFASVKELRPDVLIVDSLQTVSTSYCPSAPGSVGQLREVTVRLMTLAKTAGICVWLVGHVTKDGAIAGPKTVEHMVDTVLYFEGESGQSYRLLRTVKNRFGSTRELGVFEMDSEGLVEVTNPSALFLSERLEAVSGTAVGSPIEGSRPLLVEFQALVTPSGLAVPRRTSVGMDGNRISLLAAILEKHLRLKLAEQDLFFNIAGGLKITEPACDLAAVAAIWSSFEERALPLGWAFVGEVGLTGEVRRVSQCDLRVEEAKRQGFQGVVLPRSLSKSVLDRIEGSAALKIRAIDRIEELPKLF